MDLKHSPVHEDYTYAYCPNLTTYKKVVELGTFSCEQSVRTETLTCSEWHSSHSSTLVSKSKEKFVFDYTYQTSLKTSLLLQGIHSYTWCLN